MCVSVALLNTRLCEKTKQSLQWHSVVLSQCDQGDIFVASDFTDFYRSHDDVECWRWHSNLFRSVCVSWNQNRFIREFSIKNLSLNHQLKCFLIRFSLQFFNTTTKSKAIELQDCCSCFGSCLRFAAFHRWDGRSTTSTRHTLRMNWLGKDINSSASFSSSHLYRSCSFLTALLTSRLGIQHTQSHQTRVLSWRLVFSKEFSSFGSIRLSWLDGKDL